MKATRHSKRGRTGTPKHRGLILVLSAPSGAGKTTLAKRLLRSNRDLHFSVSYTTRSRRSGERSGRHYHFVSHERFAAMRKKDGFVECAEVHGNWYGSPWDHVREARETGRPAVFDIDVQGGLALRRALPEAVLVFVLPPSIAELERRLRGRHTDSDEQIARRLKRAREEIRIGVKEYDYLLINERIPEAMRELRSILQAELLRKERVDTRPFLRP